MSPDMLGSIRRALPKLPRKHLGLVRDVIHKLGGDDADTAHDALAATLREKAVPVVKDPVLELVKRVSLTAVSAKDTSQCLIGTIYGYRDSDIDRWLRKTQLAKRASTVSVYGFSKEMPFGTMARSVVKVGEDVSLDRVGKLLKKRKHTVTLSQLEQLIERQERGEDVGLRTDGWANFAFVENEDGSVSVVGVGRSVGRWDRSVRSLGRGRVWYRDGRLVLSNSAASAL